MLRYYNYCLLCCHFRCDTFLNKSLILSVKGKVWVKKLGGTAVGCEISRNFSSEDCILYGFCYLKACVTYERAKLIRCL